MYQQVIYQQGDPLHNGTGAIVDEFVIGAGHQAYVLASRPFPAKEGVTEFISWAVDREGDTVWGRYFPGDEERARADFKKRVGR